MKHNKITTLMIILMLVVASLSGRDIKSEVVTGATRQEAEQNAINNLTNYLSVDVSSSTITSSTDTGSTSDVSLREDIEVRSTAKLIGVRTTAEEKNGKWLAVATISESETSRYKDRVNALIPVLSSVNMEKTGTLQEKIDYYFRAKLQYRDFNTYVEVLNILTDGKYRAPELSVSIYDIDARYNSVLNSRHSAIDQESLLLEGKAKRGELTEEERARKEELEKEKQEIQKKRDSLLREQELMQKELARQAGEDEKLYLQKLAQVSMKSHPDVSVTDPVQFILGIEDYRNIYSQAKANLISSLSDDFDEFETKADKLAVDRMSADRLTVDALLDEYGHPTADYIEMQMENDLDPAIRDLYKVYYSNARKKYDATMKTLGEIRKEAESNIEILNKANFTASRFYKEVISSITYKGKDWKWVGNAYLDIAGQEVIVPFEIPFSKITGVKVDSSKWIELQEILNMYHKVLTQAENAYDVIVNYHIEGSLESNRYRIFIDEITVINPLAIGDDMVLYNNKNIKSIDFNITSSSVDMTNTNVYNRFDISETLPEYKPLGLIPEPDLTIPELSEVRKARKHDKSELPLHPQNIIYKDRYATGSTRSMGIAASGLAHYSIENGKSADIFSLGLFWRGKTPLYTNAHPRITVGGSFGHLRGKNMMVGADLGFDFMHYLTSFTYFSYGIDVNGSYGFDNSIWHVKPAFTLGLGAEIQQLYAEVDAALGCSMTQDNWIPQFDMGMAFRLGIYLR